MIFRSTYSKPILLIGNGVRAAGAVDLLYEFAKKTDIPVLTTMVGVDMAQGDMHIGFVGAHGNRIANMILAQCDLIVSVGARLGIRQVGKSPEKFAPKADLIRVDIDEAELNRDIKKGEIKYSMDAKEFFTELLKEEVPNYSAWKRQCLKAKKELEDFDKTEGNQAVETISSLLPENPVVAVDVGQHQCWCAQSLDLKGKGGRILLGGGYGAMGCGLPFAIGAAVYSGEAVYCVCGDGGLQMNIQELETVRRENLPVKIIVLNNRVLGKISETQHFDLNDRFAGTTSQSGYTVPNFVKIAKAYGIRACTLKSYKMLPQKKKWLTDNKSCLIDVSLSSHSLLRPKINFDTGEMMPKLPEELERRAMSILNFGEV